MKSGAKQVSTVGQEEKQAFTLVPSISVSGVLLPMQAIFMGKMKVSCPSPNTSSYAEAIHEGFVMLPSKMSTYWPTLETMQLLINDIIAPYFDKKNVKLGLQSTQSAIWKIYCWSVHIRSLPELDEENAPHHHRDFCPWGLHRCVPAT